MAFTFAKVKETGPYSRRVSHKKKWPGLNFFFFRRYDRDDDTLTKREDNFIPIFRSLDTNPWKKQHFEGKVSNKLSDEFAEGILYGIDKRRRSI